MTKTARLEPATAVHAAAISAMHAQCFDDAWSALAVAEVMTSPGVFGLLAVDPDAPLQPLGFALARLAADEAELLTLGVLTDFRRRGIATLLLADTMKSAHRLGAAHMFLEVEETNTEARNLYATHGFSAVGRRPDYYRRPNRAPVAALLLRAPVAHR